MKKMSLIAASVAVCALSTGAIAAAPQDSGWFGGLVYGKSHLTVVQKKDNKKSDGALGNAHEINNNYGIRGGFYANPNARFYATYTDGKASSRSQEAKNRSLLFSADYLFGDQAAKPFIGVSAGFNNYKVSLDNRIGSDEELEFAYGAQAGINWDLTPNIALEAGYQYLRNNNSISKTVMGTGSQHKNHTYTAGLKHTENVYASIDYRF